MVDVPAIVMLVNPGDLPCTQGPKIWIYPKPTQDAMFEPGGYQGRASFATGVPGYLEDHPRYRKSLGSPLFTSHGKAIYKGNNPI